MRRLGLALICGVLLAACGAPPQPQPLPESADPPERFSVHPGRPAPHTPTAATLTAVDDLAQPLEVGIFVDADDPALPDALAYFENLVSARDDVQLVKLKRGSGLAPRFAGFGQRGVVLKHGEQRVQLELVRFGEAGGDAHVRRALAQLSKPIPTIRQ